VPQLAAGVYLLQIDEGDYGEEYGLRLVSQTPRIFLPVLGR
jgi:hypothetical protein